MNDPKVALANRTIVLYGALNSVVGAWIHPLINPALASEPELKNRLFCLLMCGMTDAGWEYKNRINSLRKQSESVGGKASTYYLDAFEKYIALAVDVLEQINREEMLCITELRNQWLHGTWTEFSKHARTFYFAKNGRIVKERIGAAEYNKTFAKHGPPDTFIASVRDRVESYRSFFWAVDRVLANETVREPIWKAIQEDGRITCRLTIPKPDFRPDPASNSMFLTLGELWETLRKAGKV